MKREEYRKTMACIKADEQVKENIWVRLNDKSKAGRKRPVPLYWAAVILAVCVFSFAVPVVASRISSLIVKMNPEYHFVSGKIETGVYEKSDEHVIMTVEELLSDEQNVYLTVKYEAIDDVGREWIAENHFGTMFYIVPHSENWSENYVNFSYDSEEIEELKTDTERWFYLFYEASSRDYHSGQGKFVYPMTAGYEVAYLDTTGNVDVFLYELAGDACPSTYYKPTCIQLSQLSYTIYAMQNGVYTKDERTEQWLLSREESKKIHSSIYLVMEDGQRVQLNTGWMNGTTPGKENRYSDLVLSSNLFEQGQITEIDPQKVVGVEIQGAYYELKK